MSGPVDQPEIRDGYKGRLLKYRDPAARVAQTAERRRQRLAGDPEYRARLREQSRRNANPVASQAQRKVRTAIEQGRLVRPDVCENCSKRAYIEAAHTDYSQPLAIRWLCRSCHRRWDRDEPKSRNQPAYLGPATVRGEKSPSAKLTADQVIAIRAWDGPESLRSLARKYGVSHHTVRGIRNGHSWKHLLPEATA